MGTEEGKEACARSPRGASYTMKDDDPRASNCCAASVNARRGVATEVGRGRQRVV